MIQRLQTVYLLFALILGTLLYFFPLAQFNAIDLATLEPISYVIKICTICLRDASGLEVSDSINIWLICTYTLAMATVLVSIFLYTNRKLQILFIRFSVLLILGSIFLVFWYTDGAQQLAGVEKASAYSPYNLIFVAELVLLWLAARAIMADEKLVRSADRLR